MDEETELRLTAFLYLLMRDHVPTGAVFRLAERAGSKSEPVAFSAPELAALAGRYARLIAGEPSAPVEPESPEAEEVVQEMTSLGNARLMAVGPGGASVDVSEGMREWLELFSDRYTSSPFFVEEVNWAAEGGMVANENTAREVAARIIEREGREGGR
jgi:hypothetical protein